VTDQDNNLDVLGNATGRPPACGTEPTTWTHTPRLSPETASHASDLRFQAVGSARSVQVVPQYGLWPQRASSQHVQVTGLPDCTNTLDWPPEDLDLDATGLLDAGSDGVDL
jgi:hypothetical protein